MDKYDDTLISQAHTNGYDDFIHLGYDCPCPYEPDTKEASYWAMGFNDAIADRLASDKMDWDE